MPHHTQAPGIEHASGDRRALALSPAANPTLHALTRSAELHLGGAGAATAVAAAAAVEAAKAERAVPVIGRSCCLLTRRRRCAVVEAAQPITQHPLCLACVPAGGVDEVIQQLGIEAYRLRQPHQLRYPRLTRRAGIPLGTATQCTRRIVSPRRASSPDPACPPPPPPQPLPAAPRPC
eukprot:COSAG01_NODE_11343_length_1954_cov_1.530458_2_plen_178_part_00